jgi:hypothetical protein
MKKLKQLINNVYRICIVNPTGRKNHISYTEEPASEPDMIAESMLREIIAGDQLQFEPDPHIQEILRQRAGINGRHMPPVRNSILDTFLPLFSTQHIEIKMAVISLALFVLIGLGPKNNAGSDRKMHLFFLADSLADSSSIHQPAAQDTAFRIQYK